MDAPNGLFHICSRLSRLLQQLREIVGPVYISFIFIMKPLKPGQPAPYSGIYNQVGLRGEKTGEQVVAEKGEPLSPTPKPGMTYKIAAKAKHK